MGHFFPRASERTVLLIVVSVICVCHTSSHLHIFTSSHLYIFTSSHSQTHIFTSYIFLFTSSHTHIFTLTHTHLYIFTYSHLLFLSLTLTSSHLHIFTHIFTLTHSHLHAHLHIFTYSHLLFLSLALTSSHTHIFSLSLSLPPLSSLLSLSPFSLFSFSPSLSFSLWAEGGAGEESRNVNPFARNEGRSSKTEENCDFTCPGATLLHEMRVDAQKLKKIAILLVLEQPFRTK